MNINTYRNNATDLLNLSDREALELILSTIAPTAKPSTAAELLNHFGSLKTVIEAPTAALARYTTPATAEKLAALLPIIRLYRSREAETPRQIGNRHELETYCKALQEGNRTEHFYLISVNAQCRIISADLISEGSLSEAPAYPRRILEIALNNNAHSVFLCHNHPGGTCAPSREDIASTIQLQRVLSTIGIMVLDHMIVANGKCYSMAQNGDLEFGRRQ